MLDLTGFPVDPERARAYVLAHGGPREKARLEGIFGRIGPDREVIRGYEALQNPDGGFPLFMQPGNPSSVDATCFALAQLKDLPPLAGSPMASRAVSFLRRRQDPAGFWRESEAVVPICPPWSHPENPTAGAYLTANAVFTLATLDPGHMDPVARAAGWLRQEIVGTADIRRIPARTLGQAAAVGYRVYGPGAGEVAWCYDQAEKQELDAADLTWWLNAALEIGVGGHFLLPLVRMLSRLAGLQQADGAWPDEGGGVEATLQALRVLRGYGLI